MLYLSSDPKLISDDHLGQGQGPANILMPDSYHIARTQNNSLRAVGLVRREERYAGEKMKEIFCSNQSSIEKPFMYYSERHTNFRIIFRLLGCF